MLLVCLRARSSLCSNHMQTEFRSRRLSVSSAPESQHSEPGKVKKNLTRIATSRKKSEVVQDAESDILEVCPRSSLGPAASGKMLQSWLGIAVVGFPESCAMCHSATQAQRQ